MTRRVRERLGWWLMGCPFTGWRGDSSRVPWDYRLGLKVYPQR